MSFQSDLQTVFNLNERESEVVDLVCSGMLNVEISDWLGYSYSYVCGHMGRAKKKMGYSRRRMVSELGPLRSSYPVEVKMDLNFLPRGA